MVFVQEGLQFSQFPGTPKIDPKSDPKAPQMTPKMHKKPKFAYVVGHEF